MSLSSSSSRSSTSILPIHPTTSYPPTSSQSYIKMESSHPTTNPSSPLDPLLFPLSLRHIKMLSRDLNTPFNLSLLDPIMVIQWDCPVWVFDHWVEIGHAADIRKQWKVAPPGSVDILLYLWLQGSATNSCLGFPPFPGYIVLYILVTSHHYSQALLWSHILAAFILTMWLCR